MNLDELTTRSDGNQETSKIEEQLNKNSKIENFQFDTIVKKKKAMARIRPDSIKKKVEYKPFKYGRNRFDDLNALSRFLLQEYHHIEKHANRLLMDAEFIEWLKTMCKDEQHFEEWLEIL